MRLFIKNIILFSLIIIVFWGLLLSYKYCITNRISFKESPDTHFLFTGASLTCHGIDENLMHTAVNRSARGEAYLFTYLKLKEILDENPQIDTVFIECSPIEISQNCDVIYIYDNRIKYFVTLYYPLFGKEEWKVYSKDILRAVPLVLQQSFDFPQFRQGDIRHMMGSQADKSENLQMLNTASAKPHQIKPGTAGNTINFSYFRKIIDLCKSKHIKLYGVYFPVYKPTCNFDHEYFYKALNDHFPDLELLDYHYWEVPDSARYDIYHLNWYGAQLLTKELKDRFGIR